MTTQVPTRFDPADLARLDELVADGVGHSRSEVIRIAFADLYERNRRAKIGRQIVEAYAAVPQTDDEHAWADAGLADMFEAG